MLGLHLPKPKESRAALNELIVIEEVPFPFQNVAKPIDLYVCLSVCLLSTHVSSKDQVSYEYATSSGPAGKTWRSFELLRTLELNDFKTSI